MGPHGFGKGSIAVNGQRSWNLFFTRAGCSAGGNICPSPAAARSSDDEVRRQSRRVQIGARSVLSQLVFAAASSD